MSLPKSLAAFLLLCLYSSIVQAQFTVSVLEESQPDSVKIKQWQEKAQLEYLAGNTTLALRYTLQLVNLLEKKSNPDLLFDTYKRAADIYTREKLYEKGMSYYTKAIELDVDNDKKARLFRPIGNTYANQSKVDSAARFYINALHYYRDQEDQVKTVMINQDLARMYYANEDYEKALEYNNEILNLIRDTGTPQDLATIYNNIGYNHSALKNNKLAIKSFELATDQKGARKSLNFPAIYTNMGIAYQNMGETAKAIKYFQKALSRLPRKNAGDRINIQNLISSVYLNDNDVYNALQYNEFVLNDNEINNWPQEQSAAYFSAAEIYKQMYDYELALEYYQKHLELRDSIRLEERIRQQDLLQQQFLLERAEKEIKLLMVNEEIQELTINQLESERERLKLENDKQKLEVKAKDDELELVQKQQEIAVANARNQALQTEQAQQALELTNQRLRTERQQIEILELQQKEREQNMAVMEKSLELAEIEAAEQEKSQELERLEKENQINTLELQKQENFRKSVYGLIALLSLISVMILSGLIYFRKANSRLAEKNEQIEIQKEEIEKERNESDKLLLNILPEQTAQELKQKGVAVPRKHENVTVLFTDFSGFTSISAVMPPESLIEELNTCFIAFDEIIEKYGLEKIKTIGDAYMCASGIPIQKEDSAIIAIKAALEMKQFMDKRIREKKEQHIDYWSMRIGIHTGPVISGVVGKKKFAYDIWGDTVNTASRVETSGVDGKINISADTFKMIRSDFNCVYRGEMDVKHKGLMKMYFVEA